MKILVTSGATKEPVDSVRFITNMSSGRTGVRLAQYFHSKGHEVILLRGLGSSIPGEEIRSATFIDFTDLDQSLKKFLSEENVDAVFHLAAVSDYSVDSIKIGDEIHYGPFLGKINSSESIDIRLKRNFKIVSRLKDYAKTSHPHHEPFVVAFKLTAEANGVERREAVEKLYQSKVDLVVHNDLSEITDRAHPFRIVSRDGKVTELRDHEQLVKSLEEIIRSRA